MYEPIGCTRWNARYVREVRTQSEGRFAVSMAGKWGHSPFLNASSALVCEQRAIRKFHLTFGIMDVELSAYDYSQRSGCRLEMLISRKYALWCTDAANLSTPKMGDEEWPTYRGYRSNDAVRHGTAIQQ